MKNKKIIPYPLSNNESEFSTRVPYIIEQEDIPKDPHEFYQDFGFLTHSRTGEIIKRLTDYQYDIWKCPAKTVLVDKSQKSGLTTSELIHDFQECLINGKGKDLLIVGQTAKHAEEHLYTLKRLIIESEKYRKYLITKSSELYFREEQTKVRTLYIKNPDNPYRPMRIIGLPFTVSSIWSWKNVFRIHISDPAAAPIVDDAPVYAAAFSRLTNTDGRTMIEGPPAGPYGRFYELHEQFKDNKNPDFQVFHVTIYDARDNGLVTQEFINEKKIELGPLFATTYEGSFDVGVGNVFDPQSIDKAIELGNEYSIDKIPVSLYTLKSVGLDPGFGSSSGTGIVVLEHIKPELMKDKIRVIESYFIKKGDPNEIVNLCWDIWKRHNWMNTYYFVDGSNRAMVNLLKIKWQESLSWEDKQSFGPNTRIRPVSFNSEHRNMLSNLHAIITKGYLAIDKKHDKLITSLRTAYAKELSLDKEQTSYDDLLDSLRLSLKGYNIK